MPELREVYERQYSAPAADAGRYGAWRELCAENKADHVAELVRALPVQPRSLVDVGCGDGVLLTLLARRGIGELRHGFEISERAVRLAQGRAEIDRVERFDGERLPVPDGAYGLGVLSHVLEHVPNPLTLLSEVARACGAVVLEVPLEHNLSASRPAAQAGRRAIGHLHRFEREDIALLAANAGLEIVAELADPLPRAIHTFFADTPGARARAELKAATRRALFTLAPRRAERLFTVHYACICVPAAA
jgi:SAM-dependent methyltransferase